MQLKQIKIGNVTTPNNVFLAPLAGFSNFALRKIAIDYGAGLTFTEMVSSRGLCYDNKGTLDLLYDAPNEKIKAVQLFGNDPYTIRKSIENEQILKYDIVDLNFGCPAPKIFNNGDGSSLLNNLPLASKIISEAVKAGKPITAKFRTGITEGNFVTRDFAKMCEDSGASLITIHGRTKQAVYSGDVNFSEIEKAKLAVNIPVIANGGIFCSKDADIIMDRTGADGVMLARGGCYFPYLFAEITKTPFTLDRKAVIFEMIDLLKTKYSDRYVTVNMRKQIAGMLKNLKFSGKAKLEIMTCDNTDMQKQLLNQYFAQFN